VRSSCLHSDLTALVLSGNLNGIQRSLTLLLPIIVALLVIVVVLQAITTNVLAINDKYTLPVNMLTILCTFFLYSCHSLSVTYLPTWWESFGSHCPQLQKFAIRVLSQTCNASGCECNWFFFERIHTKNRNRLEQKRLNDLVFVQYNLRLRCNQLSNKRPDTDPLVLDDVDPTSDWVAETHPPEFDVDHDLEMELAGQAQMDADPLLGPRGPIPVSYMAGPSGTAGRS
jgi:hypothetical protein